MKGGRKWRASDWEDVLSEEDGSGGMAEQWFMGKAGTVLRT